MRTIPLAVSEMTLARIAQMQADRIRTAHVNLKVFRGGCLTTRRPIDTTRECRAIHRSIPSADDRRLFRGLVQAYLHPEAVR